MLWDTVVSVLQDTAGTLLSGEAKSGRTNTGRVGRVVKITKNSSTKIKNGLPLETLLVATKQLTTAIEDVEALITENNGSYQVSKLADDEKVVDLLIDRKDANVFADDTEDVDLEVETKNSQKNRQEVAVKKEISSTNMDSNVEVIAINPPVPATTTNGKGRGRGRPQGSTASARANRLAAAAAAANAAAAGPAAVTNTTSGITNSSDTNNVNKTTIAMGSGNNRPTNSSGTIVSSSSKFPGSNSSSANASGASTGVHVSSGSDATKSDTSNVSDRLITIGAKYGYPSPPPLSTYNGKIGRSFYTSAYNPSTPILPNSQVAYCPGKNSSSDGSILFARTEWILCRVLRILSETRFEIQDPEPDELHPQGQIFRANYKEVILVPLHLVNSSISKLKEYKSGSRILAKYPETTTFYPAEVMASKNGSCMLRFEGEEEVGKLTPVDRVFVLPYPK